MALAKDMRFASERLRYRGLGRGDADIVVRWRSDPDNYRWFRAAHPLTMEEHLAWFERYLDDVTRYDFVIELPDGTPIGTCGLSNIDEDGCEVNYMIGETTARGQGYATEAVRALCDVAHNDLGVARVYARIVSGNEASMRVVNGGGFSEYERIFLHELSSSISR